MKAWRRLIILFLILFVCYPFSKGISSEFSDIKIKKIEYIEIDTFYNDLIDNVPSYMNNEFENNRRNKKYHEKYAGKAILMIVPIDRLEWSLVIHKETEKSKNPGNFLCKYNFEKSYYPIDASNLSIVLKNDFYRSETPAGYTGSLWAYVVNSINMNTIYSSELVLPIDEGNAEKLLDNIDTALIGIVFSIVGSDAAEIEQYKIPFNNYEYMISDLVVDRLNVNATLIDVFVHSQDKTYTASMLDDKKKKISINGYNQQSALKLYISKIKEFNDTSQ